MKTFIKSMERPDVPLWILSVLLVIAFFAYFSFAFDNTIDINVHDTYYVIASSYLFLLFSLWFACCALGYMVLKRYKIIPDLWLVLLHYVFSILSLLGFFFPEWFAGIDSNYEELNPPINIYRVAIGNISFMSILLFLIAQGIYFISVGVATLRKILSGKG